MFVFSVDGTEDFYWDSADYTVAMAGGFVSQIHLLCNTDKKYYFQGPDPIDFLRAPSPGLLAYIVRAAVSNGSMRGSQHDDIFMVGYSRGAAIVTNAAAILGEKWGMRVKGLFLFDPVDRSLSITADFVPDNVDYSYRVFRAHSTNSRRSFGRCCENSKSVMDQMKTFYTTHGGMGGVPWGKSGLRPDLFEDPPVIKPPTQNSGLTAHLSNRIPAYPKKYKDMIWENFPDDAFTEVTVAQEKEGMKLVRQWMWKHLRSHGVIK